MMSSIEIQTRKRSPLRFLPEDLYSGRALAVVERLLLTHRHEWSRFLIMPLNPVFYLLAFRFGFSNLASKVTGPNGQLVDYAEFVAPGILGFATYAGATVDSQFRAFRRFHQSRVYDSIIAAPVSPLDISLAEIGSASLRGTLYAFTLAALLAVLQLAPLHLIMLCLPFLVLVAVASASTGLTVATSLSSGAQLNIFSTIDSTMLLLSTTFYPLSVYPKPLQVIVQFLPTYQGIALLRDLYFNAFSASSIAHLACLVAFCGIGLCYTTYRIKKLLLY